VNAQAVFNAWSKTYLAVRDDVRYTHTLSAPPSITIRSFNALVAPRRYTSVFLAP
jgi:hypothetical protein